MSYPRSGEQDGTRGSADAEATQVYRAPAQPSMHPTGSGHVYGTPVDQPPAAGQAYSAPTPTPTPGTPGSGTPGYGALRYGIVPRPTNGLATAGLILGILPTGVVGAIVSTLGLNRAQRIGGIGRSKALTGLVLSILWIILIVVVVSVVVFTRGNSLAGSGTGCRDLKTFTVASRARMSKDASDVKALKNDLAMVITELQKDAGNAPNAASAAAMRAEAADSQNLLTDLDAGTLPSQSLLSKLSADEAATNKACGDTVS